MCKSAVAPAPEDFEDDMSLSKLLSLLWQLAALEDNLSPKAYVSNEALEEIRHKLTKDDVIPLVDGGDEAPDTASDENDNAEAT